MKPGCGQGPAGFRGSAPCPEWKEDQPGAAEGVCELGSAYRASGDGAGRRGRGGDGDPLDGGPQPGRACQADAAAWWNSCATHSEKLWWNQES